MIIIRSCIIILSLVNVLQLTASYETRTINCTNGDKCYLTDKIASCSPNYNLTIIKRDIQLKLFKPGYYPGFFVEKKIVEYFPANLNVIFPNLTHLVIKYSQLREITKEDVSSLEKLTFINLVGNELRTLCGNVFENNHQLQKVILGSNKLSTIQSEAFNNEVAGNQLNFLGLAGNECIDKKANTTEEVNELLKEIKKNCTTDLSPFKCSIFNLEAELRIVKRDIEDAKDFKKICKTEDIEKLIEELKRTAGQMTSIKDEIVGTVREFDTDLKTYFNQTAEQINGNLAAVMNHNKDFDRKSDNLSLGLQNLRGNVTALSTFVRSIRIPDNTNNAKKLQESIASVNEVERTFIYISIVQLAVVVLISMLALVVFYMACIGTTGAVKKPANRSAQAIAIPTTVSEYDPNYDRITPGRLAGELPKDTHIVTYELYEDLANFQTHAKSDELPMVDLVEEPHYREVWSAQNNPETAIYAEVIKGKKVEADTTRTSSWTRTTT